MDGRTALHVACCEGSIEMVQHLLNMGANVHVKDRYGRSPLIDAIDNDRHEVIIKKKHKIKHNKINVQYCLT